MQDQRESVAHWLEKGPERARLEAIAFAVTLAGELVVDDEPDLAILATILADRTLFLADRQHSG